MPGSASRRTLDCIASRQCCYTHRPPFIEAINSYGFDRDRSCRLAELTPRGTGQCPALSIVSLSAGYLALRCHPDKYRRPTVFGSRPRHENRRTGEHETLPRTFRTVALSCSLKSNACRDWSAARIPPSRSYDRDQLFRLVLFHSPAGFVPGPASSAVSRQAQSATLGNTLNFRNQDRRSSHQPSSEPLWYVTLVTAAASLRSPEPTKRSIMYR